MNRTIDNPILLSRDERIVFSGLEQVVQAGQLEQVVPTLETVEALVSDGAYACGFLTFEAAAAFDPAIKVYPSGALPLAWFGIYTDMERSKPAATKVKNANTGNSWEPRISRKEYLAGFEIIHKHIISGDCYQVNQTFPLEGMIDTPPRALLGALYQAQPVDYAACLNIDSHDIISLSPELFFRLDGNHIISRPMKGTRSRGATPDIDRKLAGELLDSEKDRAENLMIVDMVRNDLGRVARTGSVQVDHLFELEAYETVWQMTSTVSAETDAGLTEIMGALFPPASVTGAPKIRAVEIINEVERFPRGLYCGTVGWWGPGRQGCFNVAIRTITRRKTDGRAWYGVGSGITSDSVGDEEYAECLTKAAVLGPVV